jgi:prolyl oligopeptidase
MKKLVVAVVVTLFPVLAIAADTADPYLWLEDVLGEKAIAWVKEQNTKSLEELEAVPVYKPIYDRTLAILDSQDRIPYPGLRGAAVYNFWQDKDHPRGILRRTTLDSYKAASPDWELVLDMDAMAKADDIPWVYKGSDCLAPDFQFCMVSLSRGGSDATEDREFDTVAKKFVDSGFFVPEAKSGLAGKDQNTLWIGRAKARSPPPVTPGSSRNGHAARPWRTPGRSSRHPRLTWEPGPSPLRLPRETTTWCSRGRPSSPAMSSWAQAIA